MSTKDNEKIRLLHVKAKSMIKAGLDEHEIVKELMKDGIESYYAEMIIANVYEDYDNKKQFLKLLIWGAGYTAAGIIASSFSFQGNSILFWGLIVLGIVNICRAFILYRKP